MITTTFDSEIDITTTTYQGQIDALELINYISKITLNTDELSKVLYFEDQTNAEFTFSPTEIRQIVHALLVKISSITAIRVAILNTHPRETALSLIAIRLLQAKNIHAKVFSTREAALDWLLLDKKIRQTY